MWLKGTVALILTALIAPIIIIFVMSFTSVSYFQFPPPGYSFKWYQAFFEDVSWMESLFRSLQISFFTTILAVVIGTLAANAVVRLNFPGKQLFMGLMVAPMIIPVIIVGIALYRFFSPLQMTGTMTGMVLSHSILSIPMVFVTVLASLKGMDRNLELAAMGLGSTPIEAFFKVTFPFIRPAIFSGALFAFLTSFDELVVTVFLAGPTTKTLPVKMWEDLRTQVDPTIAAISTILIIGIVFVYLLQGWFSERAVKAKSNQ
ncbi:MAG TPA: ABC transporter permease [Bacillus bacterium]|uniref:Polyamine ABC transporter permease n=1 Tax=Siminovitchia fordii TaxID=254759 RepID=A0ABQ4K9F5_9BACI|nr:ABC transporter permease [Siminovitchia fordii]GIN22354.1 polyamine ABC transporter permease [Siminovitchia fordii]HBZ11855.1 ABC transporter permease [Bacillus sp. (in: firmicutes)]